jgi:hypothetical protein
MIALLVEAPDKVIASVIVGSRLKLTEVSPLAYGPCPRGSEPRRGAGLAGHRVRATGRHAVTPFARL